MALQQLPPLLLLKVCWYVTVFQKSWKSQCSLLPPTHKTKALQEPNSARYLLSCRDTPQRSWQRTDLPSPLGLPPHEDPQELDWKGLWKEKKSKCYRHITLHGCCCFCPRVSPPHSCLFTRDCTRIKHPASSYMEGLLPWSWWWKEIFRCTEFGCLPNALTHPLVCLITAFAMPRAHPCSQARASGWLSEGNCTYTDFACGEHNNTTQFSSPWNTFKPSHSFLRLPYAKRVHRQRPWPEECKLTWLCVCPCDPRLSREWRNSRRDSAPLWNVSTAPHSGSALERTKEDKIFHYSVLLQSYWLKHCNHFLSVNYFIGWFPPSRPFISLKDSSHEYIH